MDGGKWFDSLVTGGREPGRWKRAVDTAQGEGDLMSFRGNYEYQLDRGRVAIPPRYREDFNAGAVMIPGVERCIEIWTLEGYESHEALLDEVPIELANGRMFRRAVSGYTFDVQKDAQGRLLIPPRLIEYAGLTKDVAVVGARECLEVWDRGAWEAQLDALAATRSEVLGEIGLRKQQSRLQSAHGQVG